MMYTNSQAIGKILVHDMCYWRNNSLHFILNVLNESLNHLKYNMIQGRIAQLVAYRLGTGEVLGSNPGKGDNF